MNQLTSKIDKILSNYQKKLTPLNTIFIDSQNLINNFIRIKKSNPDHFVLPVLKSNAYGHGIKEVVSILKSYTDTFIVDSYYEALKIKQISSKLKIILIGSIHPDNLKLINYSNISLCVQDELTLYKLIGLHKSINIHLKINTGMNRQGIDPFLLPKFLRTIKDSKLNLEGVYSHLADADNLGNDSYTQYQYQIFRHCLRQVKQFGFNPKYIHLSATSGINLIRDPDINTIRLGIGLYASTLTFKASIVNILKVKKGEKVGYNCTYTVNKNTTVGVISAGYFEGVDRRLSNKGVIRYKNKFYPIIGRVCMNLTIIDFKNSRPLLFDQVEVISSDSTFKNSVANIAQDCQTIPYDILVHLDSSIKRIIA